jgi:anti-anti-sigma factor
MPESSFTPDDIASVSIEDHGTVVVLRVAGEIDASTAKVVGDPLFSCLDTAPRAVVIDLAKVEFIGSTGLNILLRAHRKARGRATALRIVAGTHAVLRTLEVSGLDTHLPLSRSVPEALSTIDVAADAGR